MLTSRDTIPIKRNRLIGPSGVAVMMLVLVGAYVQRVVADTNLPAVHHEDIILAMPAEATPPPEPPAPPPPPADIPKPADPDLPNPDAAPPEAPEGVKPEVPKRPYLPTTPPGKVCLDCVVGGTGDKPTLGDPPPLPPPPPEPVPDKPIPVGGKIEAPAKVKHMEPRYPAIAQSARVQGVVIIQTTIGTDGRVIDAKVLRPVALLDQAALEAVRQWVFTPTRLNGQPVAVIMTVTVNFTLKEPDPAK